MALPTSVKADEAEYAPVGEKVVSLDSVFALQINVLDKKAGGNLWSKGDSVVKFTYDGEIPYVIYQGDDKMEEGNITAANSLDIKYGTNYIPGDSMGSVCIGCENRVFWSSSNSKVVEIDGNGNARAKKNGSHIILSLFLSEFYTILPPPRTMSPSYRTTACPGVIALCGCSKVTFTVPSGIGYAIAGCSCCRYRILA